MSRIALAAELINNELEFIKLLLSITNKPLIEIKKSLTCNKPFFEIDSIRDENGIKSIKNILVFADQHKCKIKVYELCKATDQIEPKYELTHQAIKNMIENAEDEPEFLLEEDSPLGTLTARVEERAKTVYFYLENTDGYMRSCWICNKLPVEETECCSEKQLVDNMAGGTPPTIPFKHCRHAAEGMLLDEDLLEVVWFEELDRAALLYDGEIMVVMPPWEAPSDFMCAGFSREFAGSPLLGIHSLDDFPEAEEQVERAKRFWMSWNAPDSWQKFRDPRIALLEQHYGPHTHYFGIDGGQFPPKALLVFDQGDHFLLITIGVSILAQPTVFLATPEPELYRRIEFGIAVDKAALNDHSIQQLGGLLSDFAKMPWRNFSWYGHGHTLECDIAKKDWYHSLLLVANALNDFELPSYAGDPVNLLWLIPISEEEMAYKKQHSSEELLQRLDQRRFIIQGSVVD